jgi:hypothetical protein
MRLEIMQKDIIDEIVGVVERENLNRTTSPSLVRGRGDLITDTLDI